MLSLAQYKALRSSNPTSTYVFTVKANGVLERALKHTTNERQEESTPAASKERACSLGCVAESTTTSNAQGKCKHTGTRRRFLVPGRLPHRAVWERHRRLARHRRKTRQTRRSRTHRPITPLRLHLNFAPRTRKRLREHSRREALLDTAESRALVHLLKSDILAFLEEEIRHGIAEPRCEGSRTRKAAELQRVNNPKTLSAMSSADDHELRQPLQAIRSEAGNIATRVADSCASTTRIFATASARAST